MFGPLPEFLIGALILCVLIISSIKFGEDGFAISYIASIFVVLLWETIRKREIKEGCIFYIFLPLGYAFGGLFILGPIVVIGSLLTGSPMPSSSSYDENDDEQVWHP